MSKFIDLSGLKEFLRKCNERYATWKATDALSGRLDTLDTIVSETKADKDTEAVPGNLAKFDEYGNPIDAGVKASDFVKVGSFTLADGLVDTRSAGTAQEFVYRASGGDGIAYMKKVKGNTVVSSDKLVNNDAASIETVGFNQWNEQWESGIYSTTTGAKMSGNGFRNTNPIPAFPSTYYGVAMSSGSIVPLCYDAEGNFLSNIGAKSNGQTFQTHANTRFICFYTLNQSSLTYQNDICINLSDASRNGTYEPYRKNTLLLNLNSLTGKLLDGQGQPTGESEPVCPNGLASIGSDYDKGIVEDGYMTKVSKAIEPVVSDLGAYDYLKQGNVFTPTTAGAYTPTVGGKMLTAKGMAGRMYVFQQLPTVTNLTGVTSVLNSDNSFTVNGTATAGNNITRAVAYKKNHKYLFHSVTHSGTVSSGAYFQMYGNNIIGAVIQLDGKTISTATETGTGDYRLHFNNGVVFTDFRFSLYILDLTDLFGAGNEPATVADFEALVGSVDYFEANAGSLGIIAPGYASAAAFKTAVTGDELQGVLDTPKTYLLDTPVKCYYPVDEDGTERAIFPVHADGTPSAPFCADTNYSISIANLVRKLNA